MAEKPAGTRTVLELLTSAGRDLDGEMQGEARLAAEVLLSHALGCRRIDLYTRFDQRPTPDELARFAGLLGRARRSEPVAYLVGHKEFYSLTFKVTDAVLIPRPETELLVAEAVGHLRALGRGGRAWDVCTGSGCVAVAVASEAPGATVLATDFSPQAVAVAAENVRAHRLTRRVACRVADLLTPPEDWPRTPFDAITANPPYVAAGDDVAPAVSHEPRDALYAGPDGLDVIRPLVGAAGGFLAPGGALILEFGAGQADAVRDLIVAAGAFGEPRILRDHQGLERAAVATRK